MCLLLVQLLFSAFEKGILHVQCVYYCSQICYIFRISSKALNTIKVRLTWLQLPATSIPLHPSLKDIFATFAILQSYGNSGTKELLKLFLNATIKIKITIIKRIAIHITNLDKEHFLSFALTLDVAIRRSIHCFPPAALPLCQHLY